MSNGLSLDRQTFKTLASDSRVDIIKFLDERRMTLSELADRLDLSVSTVKEHLDNLVSAGLIEQKDEGRKWKYYELTSKGEGIVNPVDTRVVIVLGVSFLLMVGSVYGLFNQFLTPEHMLSTAELGVASAPPRTQSLTNFPVLEVLVLTVSAFVTGFSAALLVKKSFIT